MIAPKREIQHGIRRNDDAFLLSVPAATRYNRTNGAFSISAPRVWNALPYEIRSSNDKAKFKSELKTHYFQVAFKDTDHIYDDIDLIS